MKTIVVIDVDGKLFKRIKKSYTLPDYDVKYCMTLLDALSVPVAEISLLAIDPQSLNEGEAISYIESLKIRNPQSRVLLCSRSAEYESMAEALSAGADDYIVAPFSQRVLEDHIDRML